MKRAWAWIGATVLACAVACATTPPPAPPLAEPAPPEDAGVEEHDGEAHAEEEEEEDASAPPEEFTNLMPVDAGLLPPVSKLSYEQATATPEPLSDRDDHLHLTDVQLMEPMRGVPSHCRVPAKAKVTVKAAIREGRAIGVTVRVVMPKTKKPKKPTKAQKDAAKARAKSVAALVTCVDRTVRGLTWPPSRRRDTITTTF
ncbi:MAG: hypothetical protein KIT84_32250 [Labilithrix sp.]|nr:hypothetical protein [Labilithrix sp.]MCW5815745.1 hypothetical protein [Labilithrix sp.]